MKVRLMWTSKRRVPKNGILSLSTWPSSITSPVLISLTALSTVCGFMWLTEPRSSLAPHFDGQRWLSGGGVQLGVCASATLLPASIASRASPNLFLNMVVLPKCFVGPVGIRSTQHGPAGEGVQASVVAAAAMRSAAPGAGAGGG